MQQTEQKQQPAIVKDPLSLREITKLLIKHYDLQEGLYDLSLEFTVGFGPIGPSPDAIVPGIMVGINKLGLIQATEAKTPSTVDAKEVHSSAKKKSKKSILT